jgi:S-adenosylmethionine decarboxylase
MNRIAEKRTEAAAGNFSGTDKLSSSSRPASESSTTGASTTDQSSASGEFKPRVSCLDSSSASNSSSLSGSSSISSTTASSEGDTSEGEELSLEGEAITGSSFEGPEKNIEVLFKSGVGHSNGCRELDRTALDEICAAAKCTIVSQMSNEHLDAYVLSESSLFVYSHKVILKTCGQTTLLRCLEPLFRLTADLNLELEWLGYSRKNFMFPEDQAFPHCNFQDEFNYLKKHKHLDAKLGGSGYVLGPITGDHWLVYVSDKTDEPLASPSTERTLNIMMFDLAPDAAAEYFLAKNATAAEMTTKGGISELVPGAKIDDRAFEPCGYSMNALLYGSYTTVHVTPEQQCSYASFETNTPLVSYTSLINNVLAAFRPGRVVVTMMADEAGLKEVKESPFENSAIMIPGFGLYTRSTTSFTKVEGDCCVLMGNWERELKNGQDEEADRAHRKVTRMSSF